MALMFGVLQPSSSAETGQPGVTTNVLAVLALTNEVCKTA